ALLSARAPEGAAPKAAPSEKSLAAGDRVTTRPGQPRRVVLPDGAIVYLQERSALEVKNAGHVTLSAGEAFFETAGELKLSGPKRQLTAKDSRFGVTVGKDGDTVVVASGRAKIDGINAPVLAGQQLAAGAKSPTAAPRVSHLVAWTRDLRRGAPLVPKSDH